MKSRVAAQYVVAWLDSKGCHRIRMLRIRFFQPGQGVIVLAYAEGDQRALKNLLSRDVYEGFEAAIRERES